MIPPLPSRGRLPQKGWKQPHQADPGDEQAGNSRWGRCTLDRGITRDPLSKQPLLSNEHQPPSTSKEQHAKSNKLTQTINFISIFQVARTFPVVTKVACKASHGILPLWTLPLDASWLAILGDAHPLTHNNPHPHTFLPTNMTWHSIVYTT